MVPIFNKAKEKSKIFLILYCSCVYDGLLHKYHSAIETSSQPDPQASCSVADSDDVYYRFGGAAIASMLHSRYAHIKDCALADK